jgi:uncharacterized protein
VIGTVLNAAAIVLGGTVGLIRKADLSSTVQARLKVLLGAFTVFAGLSMALGGFSGSLRHRLAQFGVALLALMLGHLTGQLMRLQKGFNKLGQIAQSKFKAFDKDPRQRFNAGFLTCSILFCASPLAVLGALHDGVLGSFRALAIKAVLDGLATMAFVRMFGWGVLLSAIPVLAFQGTLTLGGQWVEPYFREPAVEETFRITGGLLLFTVSLVLLDIRKVRLADYLPALVYAPVLSWYWLRG